MQNIQESLTKIADLEIQNSEDFTDPWPSNLKKANISPTTLLFPSTIEALAQVLATAQHQKRTVMVCGNGNQWTWGGLSKVEWVVSTQKLNRLIDHAVGDLTVTVEAGMTLGTLQEILAQQQQFLPLDPAYPDHATVGGLMATADAGSWRHRFGGVRDLVLGLSFVRADGEIAKAGGRVVKNVAGYDLMKLFTGSYGTLGAIATITFRTYPIPENSATVVLTGKEQPLSQTLQTLLNSTLTPTCADLLSPQLVKDLQLGQGLGLMVRFQSIPESVTEQSHILDSVGKALGLTVNHYPADRETPLWQQSNHLSRIPTSDQSITCKLGILPTQAVSLLQQLETLANGQIWGRIHTSSGLGEIHLQSENGIDSFSTIRSFCQEKQGFLTLLESPLSLKQNLDPWGYPGNSLEMMKRIKAQFDPNNILNPGKFVGGI